MSKFQAVVFDMDGTLINTEPMFMLAMNDTTKRVLGRQLPAAQLRSFIGPPLRESMLGLAEGDADLAQRLLDDYRNGYIRTHTQIPLFDGVKELLEQLLDAGFRLGVATSKPQDRALLLLQHLGVDQLFEVVCGAPPKEGPGSEKYLIIGRALRELGISDPASQAVMVGDRCFDVEGAAHYGMRTIMADWARLASATERASAWRVAAQPHQVAAILSEHAAHE